MREEELLKKYNALYLEIIMRYREAIENGEKLYVAELPKLIMPQDENVQGIVNKIKADFPAYNFDENFLETAQKAHKYVKESVATISPPVQFWLRPGQTVSIGAGDVFDKIVLLCTMLIALGNITTKIMSVIKEEKKKHVVYAEFKGKLLVIDIEDGVSELENREALLAKMGVQKEGEITAYEFNDKMYNNLV